MCVVVTIKIFKQIINLKKKEENTMTLIQLKNNKNSERFPRVPLFLGDFFNDFMSEELTSKNIFKSVPLANIIESNDKFTINLAVPGMEKSDFKIQVENWTLTISSEKKNEINEDQLRFTRKEFSYTSFVRSFTLPEHVLQNSITAEYINGVLTLNIPKKEEAKENSAYDIQVS